MCLKTQLQPSLSHTEGSLHEQEDFCPQMTQFLQWFPPPAGAVYITFTGMALGGAAAGQGGIFLTSRVLYTCLEIQLMNI